MIPFVHTYRVEVFGHEVGIFGPLVVFGVLVGIAVALKRTARAGLEPKLEMDLIWHALVFGFLSAHAFDVLAYYPERALENPLELLRFWGTMSSFGGMIGGLFGMLFFFYRERERIAPNQRLGYVDTIAYGFPFAWIFGRSACTVVFDHPGTLSSFPLASSLESEDAQRFAIDVYRQAGAITEIPHRDELAKLGIHNLGFYELLYTLFVIVPVFILLGRRARPNGFFLAAFFVVYAPIRFMLDFARMSDARYFGFTPGQYAAVLVFVPALALALRLAQRGDDEQAARA